MLSVLDADAVRAWCSAGRTAMGDACRELDDLNVYPVPDGDTGTNLLLTCEAVDDAVRAAGPGMAETVQAMAHGALMGARGNSGVILAQLLRGMAEVLRESEQAGADGLARALDRAAVSAYAAVASPVEGTVLTVARAAADAALALVRGDARAGLGATVAEASRAAAVALARTTAQLPALAAAGVVDAGGRGLCVLLEALERVVTGAAAPVRVPGPLVPRTTAVAERESGSEAFACEVQYLLHGASEDAVRVLCAELGALGDSLVVVGGDGLHNVHVHVNDTAAALAAGERVGTLSRTTVTRFAEQVAPPAARRAVVAVAPGEGLAALLEGAGATVVAGGPGARPSTAQLLEAVRATGAAEVVLLPGDADGHPVAHAAAAAAPVPVRVVATTSPLQALAALAVADPDLPLDDDVAALAAAALACRCGSVVTAVKEADTSAGPCLPGDLLGVVDGVVVVVGVEAGWVARRLLERLAPGAELVTLVTGADAPGGLADDLAASLRAGGAEVVVCAGGQPRSVLLVGCE